MVQSTNVAIILGLSILFEACNSAEKNMPAKESTAISLSKTDRIHIGLASIFLG